MSQIYLLNGQIQKGEVVSDWDDRLGSFAAHRGSEATVELDHHQLVQHLLQRLVVGHRQVDERNDLEKIIIIRLKHFKLKLELKYSDHTKIIINMSGITNSVCKQSSLIFPSNFRKKYLNIV